MGAGPTTTSAALAVRHVVAVDGVPPPGAFSRATVYNGLVYVSGTGASNDTGSGEVLAARCLYLCLYLYLYVPYTGSGEVLAA